jgi:uncharacterized protein
MRIAISGSSGLIGTALARSLRRDGHEVIRLVRGDPPFPDAATAVRWHPVAGTIDTAKLEGIDAAVNLAGRPIGGKRWSAAEKREVVRSRIDSTRLLSEALAGLDAPPPVLLSASGIGVYGNRQEEVLDEGSTLGEGFMAELCRSWEAATAPAEEAGLRVAHLRTGLVLSGEGGLLERPVQLMKLGLGGRLGRGDQWWSWIAIADEVGAIRFLMDHDVEGPVNLTGPAPVTNREFTEALGRVLHRPTLFPAPAFGVRLVLGSELADEVVLAGQRVLPKKLQEAGYAYTFADVELALRAALGR